MQDMNMAIATLERCRALGVNIAIIEGIVAIGHAFGLNMIAEGVETEEQMRLLVSMGCRYGQGYAIGRPMPVLEFERWMYQWR